MRLGVPIGLGFAFATAVVFGIASIAALMLFLLIGMTGLGKVFEKIPSEYNDAMVGFVIAAVGVYLVLLGCSAATLGSGLSGRVRLLGTVCK